MSGRSTFLWLALAAIVGFGLFHVKYKVQALEEELSHLTAAILEEQQQIHVLEAEWSYLNQPSRLEDLAGRYLDLATARTAQIGTIADLPLRAPAADGIAPGDGGATLAGGPSAPPANLRPPTKAIPAVRTSRLPRAPVLTPVGMTR